ncbi:MAG: methyltransferase domain-containing protein [Gammaproteobacteria bacterium]|nr:methyltransferase domain-containing protein [Gammaproteobacteria bacterium]
MTDPAFPDRFFEREDEAADAVFYREPRFVAHIDDDTIAALTGYYGEFLPPGSRVLDLMSSWISHLPDVDYARVAGLGMNERELAANPRLTDAAVHDLNDDPHLPYEDAAFDRALIAVSIQYLVQPLAVFGDLARVLTPGGRVAVAMSHRCFPTKAILAFRALGPVDRVRLVSAYLHHAGFVDIGFEDRSPAHADPLWIVVGTRPGAAGPQGKGRVRS